jgi:D-glycero-D-manno-heptose 1,7-bisphosphate phosphatase
MKKQVLFLDLDGTIIETLSGDTFPRHIGDMKFRDGILDSLKNFILKNKEDIRVFIVTNQGGIHLGYVEEKAFQAKLQFVCSCIYHYMYQYVDSHLLAVDGAYCVSTDNTDDRRKPNTGMLEQCLEVHDLSIDKDAMLMVGDTFIQNEKSIDTDRQTAENFCIDYMDVEEFIAKYNKL